jgi:hypothetical protein
MQKMIGISLLLPTVLFSLVAATQSTQSEKQTLVVQAVSYRAIPHERTAYYQTQGYSSTNCYGSGMDTGYWTSLNLNCQTVTTPPQTIPITVRSIEVYNRVQSGNMTYTITCSARWIGSHCSWLIPGDSFQAEMSGTTMWILGRKGGNMGKPIKAKFRILDARPGQ